MNFRMNIQKKLVLLLFVFGLVPVFAVMPVIFNNLNGMKMSRLDEMKTRTSTIGETIDRNLFERYGDVQAFTVNAATKNPINWYAPSDLNPLINSMNDYIKNYGLYKIMVLVDLEGKVAAVNTVDNKDKPLDTSFMYALNFKEANWFKKVINKEFLKSDTLDGTVVEQPQYDEYIAKAYNEDGFVITFAAPVYDDARNVIGVWANFADFGVVEDIVKEFYKDLKESGQSGNAFAIQGPDGTALLDYDPAIAGTDIYKRDSAAIGYKKLVALDIPAAEDSLKKATGNKIVFHASSQEEDVAAWSKSDGALGYSGLEWVIINHQPANELFADIDKTKRTLYLLIGIAIIVLIVAGSLIGTFASRPIRRLAAEINRLSEGDYSKEVKDDNRSDEIGEMVKSLNSNVRKVRDIVINIKNAASSVNSAASEIAAGSSDLSMRTEQQASNLEETAASMEEITGTVKQNSANASVANDLSANARNVAISGGQVVQEAVSAMSNIEKSSQKISDIIGVIDEIAFQTNLLALNAAVEAARAGDAGKGFAVVASEVRALAGRSASASKEIKALINESAIQVKSGADLVNKSGETLKGIVNSIQEVAGIVSEIASASSQQSTGIDEINSAVTQMDEVTQQNAALVEENTAAAQSMLEQARSLENLVSFFKVEESHHASEVDSKPIIIKAAVKPAAKPAIKKTISHYPKSATNGKSHQADDDWEQF